MALFTLLQDTRFELHQSAELPGMRKLVDLNAWIFTFILDKVPLARVAAKFDGQSLNAVVRTRDGNVHTLPIMWQAGEDITGLFEANDARVIVQHFVDGINKVLEVGDKGATDVKVN